MNLNIKLFLALSAIRFDAILPPFPKKKIVYYAIKVGLFAKVKHKMYMKQFKVWSNTGISKQRNMHLHLFVHIESIDFISVGCKCFELKHVFDILIWNKGKAVIINIFMVINDSELVLLNSGVGKFLNYSYCKNLTISIFKEFINKFPWKTMYLNTLH